MKRQVPGIITTIVAICSFIAISSYKINAELKWPTAVDKITVTIECVAMFMGMWNLTRVHSGNIRRRRMHWQYSLWLLAYMFGFFLLGIATPAKQEHVLYRFLYDKMSAPAASALYAMTAYFLLSACYRSFKARNIETLVMILTAIWVMLANVPVGDVIWSSEGGIGMAGVRDWFTLVPNAAVNRAISVGTFFGIFFTRMRLFLGLERRHLGIE